MVGLVDNRDPLLESALLHGPERPNGILKAVSIRQSGRQNFWYTHNSGGA